MKAKLWHVGACSGLALALACGDDAAAPMDSGAPDATLDEGPAPQTVTLELRVEDLLEAPLMGVHVAVDPGGGERVEGTTDASGSVDLVVSYTEDRFSGVAALEGYFVAAYDGLTLAELREVASVPLRIGEVSPEAATDLVRVRARATGEPTAGRWCLAFAEFQVSCIASGMDFDARLTPAQLEAWDDYGYATAYTTDGDLFDFARVDWVKSETEWTLDVAFDGELDDEPEVQTFTMRLPSDPASPYRSGSLPTDWLGWVVNAEPGTYLGTSALTDLVVTEDTLSFRVHSFPTSTGEAPVWAFAPHASFTPLVRTFRWLSGAPDPAQELTFLDGARLTGGDTWDGRFEWIAPADDIDFYQLVLQVGVNRGVVGLIASGTATSAQMPALPSAYDPSVSFPIEGAGGQVQVNSRRGNIPPDATAPRDPFAVDGEISTGPPRPMAW